MPRSRWVPCVEASCPHLRPRGGDCPLGHVTTRRQVTQRRTDANRPTAKARGYDANHERRFRRPVLRRDPICVLCGTAPSAHADHWPRTRRQLIDSGLDPNDPRHGRGLCGPCHSSETAKHDGGFGNTLRSPQPYPRGDPSPR